MTDSLSDGLHRMFYALGQDLVSKLEGKTAQERATFIMGALGTVAMLSGGDGPQATANVESALNGFLDAYAEAVREKLLADQKATNEALAGLLNRGPRHE